MTDTYKVVLTSPSATGATVYVDVTPQPTPTYNSDQAFDPNSNYGQNNVVQVRVQTPRALFLLTGVPTAGETWTILLNDRPFSYRSQAATRSRRSPSSSSTDRAAGDGLHGVRDTCNATVLVTSAARPSTRVPDHARARRRRDGDAAPSVGAAITFTGIPRPASRGR